MTMYELLKLLQPVAEQVGEVTEAASYDKDKIFGDRVSLRVKCADGETVEIKVTREPAEGTVGAKEV